jgi:hypothetical protein
VRWLSVGFVRWAVGGVGPIGRRLFAGARAARTWLT